MASPQEKKTAPLQVLILRGLPGSGKSTYVGGMDRAVVCSADDFFYNAKGQYQFDPSRLEEVHRRCFGKFFEAVMAKKSPIVVGDGVS